MYDIRQLEDDWKKYRKKKSKPWYIASAVLFIVFFFLLGFSNNFKFDSNVLNDYFNRFKTSISFKSNTSEVIEKNKSDWLVNGPLLKIEIEKDVITESKSTEDTLENILVDIPILDGKESNRGVSRKPRKKMHLNIIKSTNITAYKDVEKRFKQSHDIDDSLFLARSYYKKGMYEKSEYWALATNKVNSNIEESILIFAKSKMKLGHKNEAINVLRAHIKKTNSQEAKKLLYKIENNKF